MKTLVYVAAATLAVASWGLTGCDKDDDSNKPAPGAKAPSVPGTPTVTDEDKAGVDRGVTDAPGAEEVRDTLASLTEAAVKGKGSQVVERFVDADRNRLKDIDDKDDALEDAFKTFRDDWKAKYGKEFDIENEELAYPTVTWTIRQGEIAKGAAGAEVDVDRKADGTTEVDVDTKSGVDKPTDAAADENRNDAGRDVASVEIKESGGMAAMSIPLIHEATPYNWVIDVPDTLTSDKLVQNLKDHLAMVQGMKDKWPDDVNEAYGAVTRHMLMAVMDMPAK